MLQKLFNIPGTHHPIYSYGLMLVIGFFVAVQMARFLARRSGLNPEIFMNAGLLALIFGVIGARMSHVLENLQDFTRPDLSVWRNIWNMINVSSGGLTYYGGFLLATPALIIYARIKKVPLGLGMDIMAVCLMIGYGFGRIGCFLNGCCYGAECNLPWAVQFPYGSIPYVEQYNDIHGDKLKHEPPELLRTSMGDGLVSRTDAMHDAELRVLAARERSAPVHPTQLYSSFTAFLIAAIVLMFFTLPHISGRGFALMCMLEGPTRTLLEMLRIEPAVATLHIGGQAWGLSLSMILGVVIFALGLLLWYLFGRFGDQRLMAGGARVDDLPLPRSSVAMA